MAPGSVRPRICGVERGGGMRTTRACNQGASTGACATSAKLEPATTIYQQSDQYNVREQRSKVDNFAGALDALDEAKERNQPTDCQAQHQLPARIAQILECRVTDAQHVLTAISPETQRLDSDVRCEMRFRVRSVLAMILYARRVSSRRFRLRRRRLRL